MARSYAVLWNGPLLCGVAGMARSYAVSGILRARA